MVDEQYDRKDHKGKDGENNRDRLIGQEVFDAPMIFDALQQIACKLGIEKLHRQLHQFDKEIGDQRNVDARTDVQQNFPADKVDGCTTEK